MRAISLFSGIGGLDLAASLAGFDVVAQVEIDEFCRKVLSKHAPTYWPHAAQFADVRAVGRHNLPAADIIFGGFPCQDISLAGRRAGLAGARSGLWYEFRRIIGEMRPRAVVLENVPGMYSRPLKTRRRFPAGGTAGVTTCRLAKTPAAPPPLFQVVTDLAALGYVGRYGTLFAADAGAPHFRERFFLVAFADSNRRQGTQPFAAFGAYKKRHMAAYERQWATVANETDAGFDDGGDAPIINGERQRRVWQRVTSARPATRQPERPGNRGRQPRAGESRLDRTPDGLPAGLDFVGWPARPNEQQYNYEPPRVTDTTTLSRAARLKALGNAVVPQVAYPLFEALYERLSEEE